MRKISFVIYFHSSRIDNLLQTIRFLENREPELLCGELILVCHDSCNSVKAKFDSVKQFNLQHKIYHKSYFCNYGVNMASSDIIILLDSDRVLPENYFTKCVNYVDNGMFITTKSLYNLVQQYTDEEIQSDKIQKVDDFRSVTNLGRHKNLFSGNTVFFKSDYINAGGMDESLEGYGFVDNDMTRNVANRGYKTIYCDKDELHLYHTKEIYVGDKCVNKFKIMTAINALKYFKKWNLPVDGESNILIHEVRKSLHLFDSYLVDKFVALDQGNRI